MKVTPVWVHVVYRVRWYSRYWNGWIEDIILWRSNPPTFTNTFSTTFYTHEHMTIHLKLSCYVSLCFAASFNLDHIVNNCCSVAQVHCVSWYFPRYNYNSLPSVYIHELFDVCNILVKLLALIERVLVYIIVKFVFQLAGNQPCTSIAAGYVRSRRSNFIGWWFSIIRHLAKSLPKAHNSSGLHFTQRLARNHILSCLRPNSCMITSIPFSLAFIISKRFDYCRLNIVCY